MSRTRRILALLLCSAPAACASGSTSSASSTEPAGPRIVQPGAPGEVGRTYTADEIDAVEGLSYTDADVHFMQGMIPHHAQALDMTALVRQYATTDAVKQMALRMEISQRDEIGLMQTWLRRHGEAVEMPGMGGMHMMPGMLTPEQMNDLAEARGIDFDRLFLEYMIQHHQGAIVMVRELFASPGAAQESSIFKFAEDVDADQTMEIQRMQGLLETLR